MKIRMLVFAILAVSATGCREESEKAVEPYRADVPKLDGAAILDGTARDFDRRMMDFVDASGNDERRIASVRLLVERLLSVQMDGVPCAVQRNMMGRISHFIEVPLSYNCIRADERRFRYEVRLSLLEWQKHQLARLKPNRRHENEPHSWPDYATAKKSGEWHDCYRASFLAYRSLVNRLEFWWFPEDSKEMDAKEASVIRERIEQCLGRPMRKPTGTRTDWNWETEESAGVKEGRLFRVE